MPSISELLVPVILIFLFYLIIRGILRYRLESKRIEAGYYQRPPQSAPPPPNAGGHADLKAKRAYRNALFLIGGGIVLSILNHPFLEAVGPILVIIGLVWLVYIIFLRDGTLISRIGNTIDKMAPEVSFKDKKNHHFHRLLFRGLLLLGLGIGFLIAASFWRPLALLVPGFAILFGIGFALTIYYIVVRRDFKYIHSDEKEKGESEPPQEEIKHPEGSDENQSVQNP